MWSSHLARCWAKSVGEALLHLGSTFTSFSLPAARVISSLIQLSKLRVDEKTKLVFKLTTLIRKR